MSITQIYIEEALDKAIQFYGIEGTQEAIIRAYKNMPWIQEMLLNRLNERICK